MKVFWLALLCLDSALASAPAHEIVNPGPGIAIDLKYATHDNFLHENVYGELRQCALHPIAAAKLRAAAALLTKEHPGYKLHVWDCLRPRSVQRKMWKLVVGTPRQPYVANPERGSIHNFGFAVDLGVEDERGKLLDMGTEFDDFTPLAQAKLEDGFLKSGALSKDHLRHRKLLRDTMTRAGFVALPLEWWHFDALPPGRVRGGFSLVE